MSLAQKILDLFFQEQQDQFTYVQIWLTLKDRRKWVNISLQFPDKKKNAS